MFLSAVKVKEKKGRIKVTQESWHLNTSNWWNLLPIEVRSNEGLTGFQSSLGVDNE